MLRLGLVAAALFGTFAAAAPASAATVIIYQDPMTLDRRVVVRETSGPDRAYLCMLPPSDMGCIRLSVRRGR
jgi:hypothetical protein